jgi:TrmH family RNA methyltransferase
LVFRSGDVIVSTSNPLIKQVRSLQRRKARYQERAFVVEGFRAIEDALDAHATIRTLLLSEGAARQHHGSLEHARAPRLVSEAVFREISNVEEPQGILAIVEMPVWDAFPTWKAHTSLAVIADGLRDPGNLGTLLRSTAAADADFLAIADASVDAFNPKVVRSGMGAHFRLPIYQVNDAQLRDVLTGLDQVVIAEADGDIPYDQVDFTRNTALVIGGEADGPLAQVEYPHAIHVRIPLARHVESLNAGVAGSLLVFEAARQRRAEKSAK